MTIREGIKDLFDSLTERQAVVLIGGLVLVVGIAVSASYGLSWYRIHSLEKEVTARKEDADALTKLANAKEQDAKVYQQKIIFLENSIADIQQLAKKQDEEVSKMDATVGNARTAVEQSRSVKSIATTSDALCARLAALGHPC